MNTNLLFVHALSPLHAGTGQSIGAIDLAIAREKATGMPYLPGTSLKGALRARASSAANVKEVFGPDTSHASDHASSVLLGDANLLCLPVRSIAGTFAWVTSPFLLHRFVRDAKEAGLTVPSSSVAVDLDQCLVASESLAVKDGAGKEKVFFEDLDLQKKDSSEAKEWAKTLSGWLFDDDDADGCQQAVNCRKRKEVPKLSKLRHAKEHLHYARNDPYTECESITEHHPFGFSKIRTKLGSEFDHRSGYDDDESSRWALYGQLRIAHPGGDEAANHRSPNARDRREITGPGDCQTERQCNQKDEEPGDEIRSDRRLRVRSRSIGAIKHRWELSWWDFSEGKEPGTDHPRD